MSSSSTSPSAPSNGVWQTMAPYVVPPFAASVAIVPAYRRLMLKSALQMERPVPQISYVEGVKAGMKGAHTVGLIVGTQMVAQPVVEKAVVKKSKNKTFSTTLASAAIVGVASGPVLAVFNAQTMGLSIREALRNFRAKQAVVISMQETSFVFGMYAGDEMAGEMRKYFGNHVAVDYTSAAASAALGSFLGHPANSTLTRWQCGMKVNNMRQLLLGAHHRALGVATFSCGYKFMKDTFSK